MSHDLVAIDVSARPDAFEVSPGSTAVIVVDMQHDFAAPQGMFGRAGIPLAGIRAVIEPTRRVIEAARRAGLLVVYLTMEFDQDLANMGSATAPNRLRQVFVAPAVNRIWVGDLTAIATRSGWLYLAVLLDLYSRRVIGWAMSAKPDQHLAIEALQMALVSRRPHQGLIHHTDQGATYTSVAYQHRLAEYGIAASMSRKGNCYDNAVAESFFSTLKNDLVHERDYQTREEARAEIFEFIEVFYNRQRLHQTLGYVSPEQFETQNPVPLRGCLRNRG